MNLMVGRTSIGVPVSFKEPACSRVLPTAGFHTFLLDTVAVN